MGKLCGFNWYQVHGLVSPSLRGCSKPITTEMVVEDFDNTAPGVSSMTLSWNSFQTAYYYQPETNVKAGLQALGTVGGLFSFTDSVFALIFGRTLLSLVTGKSTPFAHSRLFLTHLHRWPSHLSVWNDRPRGSPQVQEANSPTIPRPYKGVRATWTSRLCQGGSHEHRFRCESR